MGNCVPKPVTPQAPHPHRTVRHTSVYIPPQAPQAPPTSEPSVLYPVIRRRKTPIPKTLKRMVWDMYIGAEKGEALCFCCNHAKIRQIEFHCGHVLAEVHGGSTTVDNLRPVCAQCNLSMGSTNMTEFMQKFMTKK